MNLKETRSKELQRLQDYVMTFGTTHGKRVLADIKKRWLHQRRGHEHAAAGNGVGLGYVEGQRETIINIVEWSECNPVERVDELFPLTEEEPDNGQSESTSNLATWGTGD